MENRLQAARERLKEIEQEYTGPTLDECDREVLMANRASIAAQERLQTATAELERARTSVDDAVNRCKMARYYQEAAANHENTIEGFREIIDELTEAGQGKVVQHG